MDIENKSLELTRKVEMVLDDIYPALKNYPRYEQATLARRIKDTAWDIIALLLRTSRLTKTIQTQPSHAEGVYVVQS